MARNGSFTSQMFKIARASADVRSVRTGHVARRVGNHVKGRALNGAGFFRWLWK
ncbi:MAG: hypothetical protein ABSG43_00365 [Solirubrobacteraceae bacterium]|jgi:hypothetical protein